MADPTALHDDDSIVVVDRTDERADPVAHGLAAFEAAVADAGGETVPVDHWSETDRDQYVVVGTTDRTPVARLLGDAPTDSESVIYRWCATRTGTALVVAGTDDRGLMYALLDLAERVVTDGLAALSVVEDRVETPDNDVRGVDRFVETPVEDEWLYDEGFWEYYLDRLARSRFNRFVLITGYDTAFMSPPYPFVVDVPGFPDVALADDLGVERTETRERLRRIGEMCHERGIEFLFGIWQQRPWTEYQGELVENLPEGADLADYCAAGIEQVLIQCPEIDGVQLRVNHESGVTAEDGHATAEAFWNAIVEAVAEAEDERGRAVDLNLRAKGLTDDMIDHGLATGLDVTVPTKFWCESTGLPYHNSRMRSGELANLDDLNRSRRYSYADLLEKPRAFDVLYRLWTIGTNRIFVWGDADYARRFSHATEFGDGAGFEITAPLSLKGGYYGLLEEPWPLFSDPDLRDYEWEDERYWAWYRTFGRLGYSREHGAESIDRAFRERFSDAATAVKRAYHAASKVLPLITAAHLTSHPALHNWAELDTGGALFGENNHNEAFGDTTYATAEPSDPGLFYGIDEYVADDLDGSIAGKYTPPQVARWLAHLARETRATIEAATPDAPDTGEYRATELDLAMLADLATFHAHKTHAALSLQRYRETDDPSHLPAAYASVSAMREAWMSLAERGEGAYHDDLVFGRGPAAGDAGNWTDRLDEIDADLADLEDLLDQAGVDPAEEATDPHSGGSFGPFPTPAFDLDVPETATAGEDIDVDLRAGDLDGADDVRLHYRRANQLEGSFEATEMDRTERGYRATIPGEYVTGAFDLLVYASATDDEGDVAIVPGLYHPEEPMPYRVIETRER